MTRPPRDPDERAFLERAGLDRGPYEEAPSSGGGREAAPRPTVSTGEVRRIASLARLRPDDATAERLAGELNTILEHIRTLEEADISAVERPVRLPGEPVPFRDPALEPDRLEEGAPGDRAPDWRDGFFVVPRLPGLEGAEGTAAGGAPDAASGDEVEPRSGPSGEPGGPGGESR